MAKKKATSKTVATLRHEDSRRPHIPTAEQQSVMETEQKYSIRVEIERRNRDLDPQLIWRGKSEQDGEPLVAGAPPLYIQEKVHPKVLIDDLMRRSEDLREKGQDVQLDLFGDFNGLSEEARSTEFYRHQANWTNRMILGDSLQVMASLAEREGLRGKVQCIYLDPPYGIKFNSNFQWSTTSRDVKDGNREHITREPEQVKAFRDTWRDGIHSYLTYLRDRLTVARDLLHETGSIFVQIGDENVHRVRAVMDEVFGEDSLVAVIHFKKSGAFDTSYLQSNFDHIIWFARKRPSLKFRSTPEVKDASYGDLIFFDTYEVAPFERKPVADVNFTQPSDLLRQGELISRNPLNSSGWIDSLGYEFDFEGFSYSVPRTRHWTTTHDNMIRLGRANRLIRKGNTLRFARYWRDYATQKRNNVWQDTAGGGFVGDQRVYVVQTDTKVVQRCLLMATDPGDLVLDPTCGSGTTAYVSEQWGRRWITIDTSRVSLALARARIMGARYPFYLLADSKEGVEREAELSRNDLPDDHHATRYAGNIRHGFVYERVPHITLKSIANNAEIDVIYEQYQAKLEPLREQLNAALGQSWQEWEIPRDAGQRWSDEAVAVHSALIRHRRRLAATLEVLESVELAHYADKVQSLIAEEAKADLKKLNKLAGGNFTLDTLPDEPRDPWPDEAKKLHAQWWKLRIERQKEIDASIAAKADFEYLYDKPYPDKSKVRVAGPFTVESLSPHRTLAVGADDELIDPLDRHPTREREADDRDLADFATMVLENLKKSGVQQAHKEGKINFTSLAPWPGEYIAAEGRFDDADGKEKRAGIFIGPEFGTISQPDLKAAARECGDAGFDVLIACGFNYEAHATEFNKLGRIQVLKARMNADMHMSADLKNTGKGNLFVIFGEPDITVRKSSAKGAKLDEIEVRVNGVDVFQPSTGEVRSDGADGIACWFIDTDYNEESFFVRQAYFLGAGDPYKSLKTTLKAEIDEEAWDSLHSDTSRPFPPPKSGRIAVKVINHLGDEVMKVFRVKQVLH